MENFTLHIFGYGETQINSKEFSVKVASSSLETLTPLVNAIWDKKPEDSLAEEKYHAINIFNYDDIRWMSKDGFSLKNEEDLKTFIDDLIAELKAAKDALDEPSVAVE
jgi:hypothetical protein